MRMTDEILKMAQNILCQRKYKKNASKQKTTDSTRTVQEKKN